MDFRFGKSIANAIALYADLNFAVPQGYIDATIYSRKDKDSDWEFDENIATWDVFSIFGGIGLGIEVYPCRYPLTFCRGIHFGNALLLDASISDILEVQAFELTGLAWRTSAGLDWWVSDTWSIGIEVVQTTLLWDRRLDDFKKQTFQILFRITHR